MSVNVAAAPPVAAQAAHPVLPEPPRVLSRSVLGPSAVFAALAIGSGELLFWPGLTLPYGAGVLWFALVAVGLQYVMNVEIGRYSLATGESVAVGATRLWSGWRWVLLAGAVVPWLWPGWARAGSQLITGAYGGSEKVLSAASLLLCGVLLALPARVYRLVERLQSVLLAFILLGVLALFLLAARVGAPASGFWGEMARGEGVGGLLSTIGGARGTDFLTFIGGLVFAGAGGILNLGYGVLLCEKGFGMGRYARPIVGLRFSSGLSKADEGVPGLRESPAEVARWRRWIGLSYREHALLFAAPNVFTILFISLIFAMLLGGSENTTQMSFLHQGAARFGEALGPAASLLFVAVGFAIFFTSELGILDVTSRLAAGLLHARVKDRGISASALYHAFVWFEIVVGISLIMVDTRQPYWFLVTSAVLNVLVMAIYASLTVVLNRRVLPPFTRPHPVTSAVVGLSAAVYALVFVWIVVHL
jgi:hypothetical protein